MTDRLMGWSAKGAKKMADEAKETKLQSQVDSVPEQLIAAAKEGKTELAFKFKLPDWLITELKARGFHVYHVKLSWNFGLDVVSWANPTR